MESTLPSVIAREDLLEVRLAIAEEGRANNAVIALEAQLELRKAELRQASTDRSAAALRLNEKYQISGADRYNQLTGEIARVPRPQAINAAGEAVGEVLPFPRRICPSDRCELPENHSGSHGTRESRADIKFDDK
jgi:hypothetical protein